tara:strand:- start:724 stop:1329 length:606 start_codon:yes stop_codon:yes gene_type:complete
MIKKELLQVFPTPILIVKYQDSLDKEIKFVEKLKLELNGGDNRNYRTVNSYILKYKKLNKIKKFIEESIKIFSGDVLGYEDEFYITQSWANSNPRGSFHHAHTHSNSIISGVFYLRKDKDNPPIFFNKTPDTGIQPKSKKFNTFNSGQLLVPINQGELILFPSNLNHSVPVNKSKTVRLSLSFNTFANRLGDEKTLTEVIF